MVPVAGDGEVAFRGFLVILVPIDRFDRQEPLGREVGILLLAFQVAIGMSHPAIVERLLVEREDRPVVEVGDGLKAHFDPIRRPGDRKGSHGLLTRLGRRQVVVQRGELRFQRRPFVGISDVVDHALNLEVELECVQPVEKIHGALAERTLVLKGIGRLVADEPPDHRRTQRLHGNLGRAGRRRGPLTPAPIREQPVPGLRITRGKPKVRLRAERPDQTLDVLKVQHLLTRHIEDRLLPRPDALELDRAPAILAPSGNRRELSR